MRLNEMRGCVSKSIQKQQTQMKKIALRLCHQQKFKIKITKKLKKLNVVETNGEPRMISVPKH